MNILFLKHTRHTEQYQTTHNYNVCNDWRCDKICIHQQKLQLTKAFHKTKNTQCAIKHSKSLFNHQSLAYIIKERNSKHIYGIRNNSTLEIVFYKSEQPQQIKHMKEKVFVHQLHITFYQTVDLNVLIPLILHNFLSARWYTSVIQIIHLRNLSLQKLNINGTLNVDSTRDKVQTFI